MLAAERTWLAWWRSGIATAAAAIAVGGVVPQLVSGERTPYTVLGTGYALLAVGIFVGGAIRHLQVRRQLEHGGYAGMEPSWVVGLTVAGSLLALGTLVIIIVQP
jgi:putative membrane protein